MKPTVLIYRSELLPASETFIAAQAAALGRHQAVFCGARRVLPSLPLSFQVIAPLNRAERCLFRRAGFAPKLVSAARASKPALVHAHFALDGAEALPLAERLGVPLLVTLHGYDVMAGDEAHRQHHRGRLFLKRREPLWRGTAAFLCVSEAIRARAIQTGYPEHKLRALPIGIDLRGFAKSPGLPANHEILFVGRLVPKKGCHTLLRAVAILQQTLPSARLLVAGDGPERPALSDFAARHTRGTTFLGLQTTEQVRALMRSSRCLAAPSLTAPDGDAEGLPTVLCEALALGLPVASTFHSGIPELIRDGEHGLLSPEDDAKTLARNLRLLCTDDTLAHSLQDRGRARVEAAFSLERQTALLEDIYEQIAGHGAQPRVFAAAAKPRPFEQLAAISARGKTAHPQTPIRERLWKQTLWLFSGNGLALVFQAVYFLLIGRILGAVEYGAFVGAAALVNVLAQFSSLGMEMVLLRTVARDRSAFPQIWGRALSVSGLGFLILLPALLLYGHLLLPPELQALLPFLAASDALFGKLTQLSSRALQGAGHTRWSARLLALTNAVRTGAAALLLARAAHASVLGWAHLYCAASLLIAVTAAAVVTVKLGRPRWSPLRRADLLEGLSFSFSSSAITVYNDIDKSMLLSAGLSIEAGIYGAAYRVVDVLSTPIVSLFAAASPRLFQEGAEGGPARAAQGAKSLLRWTIPFGLLAAPLLFFLAPLLPRVFGPSFARSTEALRFLCLLPLLRGLHYAWGTAITASSSQWRRTGAQAGVAALNILLNLALIPRWGWRGAAASSLVSDGALALASFAILRILVARTAAKLGTETAPRADTLTAAARG